ncbi:MAG: hypothetical protein JST89_09475 [Cyanobacteria bacterium SZAS-4]|nr:hypothetical protein [Cyanobacteria bacterium SZAS-4]
MSDIETLKLGRAVREFDSVHKNLKELEDKHGPNSPQVLELLSDMVERLSAQQGNELFVNALRSRIQKLQTAV